VLTKQQQAYNKIKNAIITYELPPETILVERTLSEQLGISRTPIREALKQLEVEGYVSNLPGKGFFVSKLYYEDFIEYFEIKESLESMAAKLCCIRKTKEIIEDLENCFYAHKEAVESKEYDVAHELDIGFHLVYIKGSQNQRLENAMKSVNDITRRVLYSGQYPHSRYDTLVIHHEKILNAIKSDDPESARIAAANHIEDVKNYWKNEIFHR
jgi:DNA-binding GntR family transcriptional regulator